MRETARKFLAKAHRALQAARTLRKEGNADFAAGRAYYAMFFAAEALLSERGLRFRKHGGVHSAFGEHFVRSGLIDSKFHGWLLDAFDKRIIGDYGPDADLTEQDADLLIHRAEEFLGEARRILDPSGSPS